MNETEREQIQLSKKIISTKKYHLIFSKKIPENRELLRLFNNGLKEIKDNGTYLELENKLNQGYYD